MNFALVDAFTEKPLAGNPCAVVLDADGLSEETMFAIAKEMNQSETAFLMKSKVADLRARYFTIEGEIPLAGHPTIASMHSALEFGWIKLQGAKTTFSLELQEGPIDIEVESTDSGNLIRMFQRKPVFGEIHDPKDVLPLFGLGLEDLKPGCVIQTVSTGTRQLMIPLRDLDALKKSVIQKEYQAYCDSKDFFSPHLFCTQGLSADAQTFARHPGLVMEDAFTGSATGGMAAFLWKYGLIPGAKFIAEQGHWMGRPGRASVEVHGAADDIETVSVAGTAVTLLRGTLRDDLS